MFDLSVDTFALLRTVVGVIPPVNRNESGYRDYQTNDLNWIYLAKNLRNAGLVESLIEFAHLAQLRETQNVEEAQKQILHASLAELDEKIGKCGRCGELLVYKSRLMTSMWGKFQAGQSLHPAKVEKLWERIGDCSCLGVHFRV